ncbi:hypothetical protein C4578_03020 [Candidatus Microgenomates bacterium]|jgi:hypothetical protein|nr:MAG: hypothetical protein C4578_03020 [Candidatus Microgenomates bacterium]
MAEESESKITADHETIRKWAEQRGGIPSMVKGTGEENGGILRFDFPPLGTKENLEHISWEEFFKIFENKNLALLYQEKTREGEESRFNKFVARKSE